MITTLVFLVVLEHFRPIARHIHFATEDGFEGFQPLFLASFVDAADVIVKFLDAKHIAMIGNGHAFHAVADGLVNQPFDA